MDGERVVLRLTRDAAAEVRLPRLQLQQPASLILANACCVCPKVLANSAISRSPLLYPVFFVGTVATRSSLVMSALFHCSVHPNTRVPQWHPQTTGAAISTGCSSLCYMGWLSSGAYETVPACCLWEGAGCRPPCLYQYSDEPSALTTFPSPNRRINRLLLIVPSSTY